MSSSPTTVSRRDAAIAALLAGAVVVVLGYASGLGVTVEPATATLAHAPPPAQPSPVPPEVAPPPEVPAAPVLAPLPVAAPAPPVTTFPVPEHTEHPAPTEPPDPEPTPDPVEPEAGGPECASLLERLPVIGPATVPLTSLLGGVLGTAPVVGSLVAPVPTDEDPASLGWILGAVVGPACCDPTASTRTRSAR